VKFSGDHSVPLEDDGRPEKREETKQNRFEAGEIPAVHFETVSLPKSTSKP